MIVSTSSRTSRGSEPPKLQSLLTVKCKLPEDGLAVFRDGVDAGASALRRPASLMPTYITAPPLPLVDIEPIAWALEAAWSGERPVWMSSRRRRFGRGTMCRGPRTHGGVDPDWSGSPRAPTETQSPWSHHAFPRIARRDVVPRAGHGADVHAQGPRQPSRGRGAWGTVNLLGSGFFPVRSCASKRVTCFRDRDPIRGRGLVRWSGEKGRALDAEKIPPVVKSLSRERRSCTYYRVDLHVHTPASADYQGDMEITADDFVRSFVERGFGLIAICDHNTGSYIDDALAAREKIVKDDGKNIAILPGVEIYASPGIHLLAILPEGGSAAISDVLSRLGLPVTDHGDTTKLISLPIAEISRIVHERGGLLIGAHCNSTHGIVQDLEGQARLEWLREVDALEVNSDSDTEKIRRTMEYVSDSLNVSIPFTFGSDSHDCASETTGMWLKMAEPSFRSLLQLTYEPELRVSRTEPAPVAHGRIVGFTTTLGVYPDIRFRLSPHLNVILGGRGAGKSAAIDLVRFAFEAEPVSDDEANKVFAERIAGFLQSVGEVLVVVAAADGETYVVVRRGSFERPSHRSPPRFTDAAQVYQLAGTELIRREMQPQEVLAIEFYGQGEVAQLANRVDEQLRLIDENLDHSRELARIDEAELALAAGESELAQHAQELELLRVEVADGPSLEERRDRLAASLADPIFETRKRWEREELWIQRQQGWVQNLLNAVPPSLPSLTDVDIDLEGSPMRSLLESIRDTSGQVSQNAQASLKETRDNLEEAISELAARQDEWKSAFETANQEYRDRLAELGIANLDAVANEQQQVEQDLAHIESHVKPEIERIQSEIDRLEAERAGLLSSLREARAAIARSRLAFIKELNSRLDGKVLVDLTGVDRSMLLEAIDTPLQGSGMQRREDQIALACEAFSPEEFVAVMRNRSLDALMALGITENNATRMLNGLTHEVLHRIERVDIPQRPSIRIKREGESHYTDLSSLSVGEKCSAILSIALVSKGKPLIIDQPEDDLDHAFIIDSIVGGIRSAKSERQIVAATHNPNVPVLGDAEMVFRVARVAGADECSIQSSGGLELPQVTAQVQSLEGGAEAFERRRRKYSGAV